MRKTLFIVLVALLLMALMPAQGETEDKSRIESTLEWVFYDGSILCICVTQTAREENVGLYGSVIGSPLNEDAKVYGDVQYGAYCEMGPTLYDAAGNEIAAFMGGYGDGVGTTLRLYHFALLPAESAPDTLHVAVVTGLVLPGGDELLEARVLEADVTRDEGFSPDVYPLELRGNQITKLTHYFVPDRMNIFMLESTESAYYNLGTRTGELLNTRYSGVGDRFPDGRNFQIAFFDAVSVAPEELVVRRDGIGAVGEEIVVELSALR